MNALPIHPAVVHFPLALAALLPIFTLGLVLAIWQGWLTRQTWGIVIALQLLLLFSTGFAMKTGDKEEEKVSSYVGAEPVSIHQTRAQRFLILCGLSTALCVAVAFIAKASKKKFKGWLPASIALSILSMVATAGTGFWVAQAGGELVYKHGAANANLPQTRVPTSDRCTTE